MIICFDESSFKIGEGIPSSLAPVVPHPQLAGLLFLDDKETATGHIPW